MATNDNIEKGVLRRSERLLGSDVMQRMSSTRVIIFGVGGVGSWCAESLVRSGIRHLTIVDSDRVCMTNCNRQLMATTKTVGQVKVDVMRSRLLEINPNADIVAIQKIYSEETASDFHIEEYDYVIDAIDSLKDKISLILHVTALSKEADEKGSKGPTLFSSMGAALRVDPTKVRVSEFWKVVNDTLASVMRKRMRHNKTLPAKKFLCVYSEELPMENKGENHPCGTDMCICHNPSAPLENDWNAHKAQVNGSLSHITGIFGFTLAGLVLKDISL